MTASRDLEWGDINAAHFFATVGRCRSGNVKMKPNASPKKLVLLSRIATLIIASVSLGLALMALKGSALIDGMVAYAWTGLGASFGPALLLALWWKGTTRQGALAGMIGGMTATILWKNSEYLGGLLDIKAAAVFISAALVVGVSLMTRSEQDSELNPSTPR